LTLVLTSGVALVLASTAASAPGGNLSAQPLAFGNVRVNSAKTLPLTITNVGTQPIGPGEIIGTFKGGPDINAWLVVVGSGCPPFPGGIAPGQSCSVNVTFRPSRAGGHKSHLVLQDNQGSLSVQVSGTGI